MGLPVYVEIDRKPVNGCEIQNSCDARSQVIMQFKLVKLEADEGRCMAEIRAETAQQRTSLHLLYGTKVLINLVKVCRNTWRTVCSDFYFSSVPAGDKLEKKLTSIWWHG